MIETIGYRSHYSCGQTPTKASGCDKAGTANIKFISAYFKVERGGRVDFEKLMNNSPVLFYLYFVLFQFLYEIIIIKLI